jgi:hypothetical protein
MVVAIKVRKIYNLHQHILIFFFFHFKLKKVKYNTLCTYSVLRHTVLDIFEASLTFIILLQSFITFLFLKFYLV